MKRSELTVLWNIQDDGGFWRVDGLVYCSAGDYAQQTHKFYREFEKGTFGADQSVGHIMRRANGYLDYLIENGALDEWFNSPTHAAP